MNYQFDLLDINMPIMNGIETLKLDRIGRNRLMLRILMGKVVLRIPQQIHQYPLCLHWTRNRKFYLTQQPS